jgi:hypothetical protein
MRIVYLSFFLFFIGSFCLISNVHSQKLKNRIIVWDVTSSMRGSNCPNPPEFCYTAGKDIDKKVREGIRKIIEKSDADQGSIHIFPFTSNILQDDKVFLNTSSGRKNAFTYISNYDIPKKPVGGTNICQAWLGAMNSVDAAKDNIIYLFTDGQQNIPYGPNGINCLASVIDSCCKMSKKNNTFTFFISLNVQNSAFTDALANTCNIKYISIDDVLNNGVTIPPALVPRINPLTINLQDKTPVATERFSATHGQIPVTINLAAQLLLDQTSIPWDIKTKVKSNQEGKLDVEFLLEDISGNAFSDQKRSLKGNINGVIKISSNSDVLFTPSEIPVRIINQKNQSLNIYIK